MRKMLSGFEEKVAGFANARGFLDRGGRFLLAVSGGADSTALLYVMCALKGEGILNADFVCAHVNHQLRGSAADADEDFVVAQAGVLNLAVITRRVDVRRFARDNKLSIETAARKLRIESLIDMARARDCRRIITAHHKDDNAETVLQRLIRGTGFRGLGGIWAVRSFAGEFEFVRPLLCVGRDEIVEYLKQRNLKWRLDKTNDDCRYRRNYIRHRLLPALQRECSSSVAEQLFELSESAQRFYGLVCGCADKLWPALADCSDDEVKLDSRMFSGQPEPIKVELVRRSLACLGSGERDLTQQHYKRIFQLAEQNISNKKIELPGGFVVCREYGNMVFAFSARDSMPEEPVGECVEIKIPGRTKFGGYLIEAGVFEADAKQKLATEKLKTQNSKLKTVERFDLDKVKLPLVVRFRQAGDRFVPLGLGGEKRIGKFLTAQKVPQKIREKVLIVADTEKIIWVWPIRMSEQAKVTAETQKILQLQITDANLVC